MVNAKSARTSTIHRPATPAKKIRPAASEAKQAQASAKVGGTSQIGVAATILQITQPSANILSSTKKPSRKLAAVKSQASSPQVDDTPQLAAQYGSRANSKSMSKPTSKSKPASKLNAADTRKLLEKPAAANVNAIIKVKKSKLVRDSFTIPDHEYKLIHMLKERAVTAGVPLKKSELLRAGILQLMELPEVEFLQALKRVDIIKTGRPAKVK